MKLRAPRILPAAFAFALLFLACSDDGPTGSGSADRTPPAIASLTPIDNLHVEIEFTEAITPASAREWDHYLLVQSGLPTDRINATPVLKPDGKTVSLTTWSTMAGQDFVITITGITDLAGNVIVSPVVVAFTGSGLPDDDPPVIYWRSPEAGSANSPVGAPVRIQFSEPVDQISVRDGLTWTSLDGPVPFYLEGGGATFTLTPLELLDYDALQTIALTGVHDITGITMPDEEWSFTTTRVVDSTSPALVSSDPPNLATNVDMNTNLSLTFSEPINQFDFRLDVVPDDTFWDRRTWSEDGTTITFHDLRFPLDENRQYIITMYPEGIYDLAGNTVAGYTRVIFSTGSNLERGSIAGVVDGDPGSGAADPTGALVIAQTWETYNSNEVAPNHSYTVKYLEDGPYQLIAFLDSNDDGRKFLEYGDALGGYGVDIEAGDFEYDIVPIINGRHATNIRFPLFDTSAISGVVSYTGVHAAEQGWVYVSLFPAGTDPSQLANPVAVREAYWRLGMDDEWVFNNMSELWPDGDYVLAAYFDVNDDEVWERGEEPGGMYGGFASPTVLKVENGVDYLDLVIPLTDPVATPASAAVRWAVSKTNPKFDRWCEMARRSTDTAARRESPRPR